jgi:hypothetical protein
MRLRHRVTFKVDTTTDDTVDPVYTDYLAAVPCSIKPVGGGERVRGMQLQAETTYACECRYYDGLLPDMIAVDDETSVTYYINRIHSVVGRDRTMLIELIEVVV